MKYLCIFFLLFISIIENVSAKNFDSVKISKQCNIFTDLDSKVTVNKVNKNDIFKLIQKSKKGYVVLVGSGEYRKVNLSDGILFKNKLMSLNNINLEKKLYKDLVKAQDCSGFIAEKDYPINFDNKRLKVQTIYKRMIQDQLEIDAFKINKLSFNSFIRDNIILKGLKDNWNMPEINKNDCYSYFMP